MGLCPVEVSGPIAVSYLYALFEAKKSAVVNPRASTPTRVACMTDVENAPPTLDVANHGS